MNTSHDSIASPINRDAITIDAERQATIQEQERIAREASRLLDVVHHSQFFPF